MPSPGCRQRSPPGTIPAFCTSDCRRLPRLQEAVGQPSEDLGAVAAAGASGPSSGAAMPFPSASSTFSLGSSSSAGSGAQGPLPGPSLYEFLLEAELSGYYDALRNGLKVSSVGQLKYVEEDDLSHLGMSRPEQRRLRKYFHKYFPQTYLRKIKQVSARSLTSRPPRGLCVRRICKQPVGRS